VIGAPAGSGSRVAAPRRSGRIFLAGEMTGRCGSGRPPSRKWARAGLPNPGAEPKGLVTGKRAPGVRTGRDQNPMAGGGSAVHRELRGSRWARTVTTGMPSLQDDAPTRSTTSTAAGTRRRVQSPHQVPSQISRGLPSSVGLPSSASITNCGTTSSASSRQYSKRAADSDLSILTAAAHSLG
jgi:hypothetical protein